MRSQGTDNSGYDCQSEDEDDDLPAYADLIHAGQALGQHALAYLECNASKDESEHTAADAEHETFEHCLTDEHSSACATPTIWGSEWKRSRQVM